MLNPGCVSALNIDASAANIWNYLAISTHTAVDFTLGWVNGLGGAEGVFAFAGKSLH